MLEKKHVVSDKYNKEEVKRESANTAGEVKGNNHGRFT